MHTQLGFNLSKMEKLTPEQVKLMSDTEQNMEKMMKDTINRMTNSCTAKCLRDKGYKTAQVVKEEGICIDRCVAKYLAFTDAIGKRLAEDKATVDMLSNPPYLNDPDDKVDV